MRSRWAKRDLEEMRNDTISVSFAHRLVALNAALNALRCIVGDVIVINEGWQWESQTKIASP
jgi:hypothetical protein